MSPYISYVCFIALQTGFCLRDVLRNVLGLRNESDNEYNSLVLIIPFITGIYPATEYRLHVPMLSEEYSAREYTRNVIIFVVSEANDILIVCD